MAGQGPTDTGRGRKRKGGEENAVSHKKATLLHTSRSVSGLIGGCLAELVVITHPSVPSCTPPVEIINHPLLLPQLLMSGVMVGNGGINLPRLKLAFQALFLSCNTLLQTP